MVQLHMSFLSFVILLVSLLLFKLFSIFLTYRTLLHAVCRQLLTKPSREPKPWEVFQPPVSKERLTELTGGKGRKHSGEEAVVRIHWVPKSSIIQVWANKRLIQENMEMFWRLKKGSHKRINGTAFLCGDSFGIGSGAAAGAECCGQVVEWSTWTRTYYTCAEGTALAADQILGLVQGLLVKI